MNYRVNDAVTGAVLTESRFNYYAHTRVAVSNLQDNKKVVLTMPATGKDATVTVGRLRERLSRQDWFLWDENRK